METLLQDHEQENKRRVQELAGELISNSIMPELVQRELDDFVHKFDTLEEEVSAARSVNANSDFGPFQFTRGLWMTENQLPEDQVYGNS